MDNISNTPALKKPCAFILSISSPVKTLSKITELLVMRKIEILFLQAQVLNEYDGSIILHCRLEKDRIKYISQVLKAMDGVNKIEWMEDTSREKQYSE